MLVPTLCTSGVKKEQIAYLLQVQFHFEIDALNISATFEITKIFLRGWISKDSNIETPLKI